MPAELGFSGNCVFLASFESRNDDLVHYFPCIVRMNVTLTRRSSHVAFKRVPSMEVLTDVTADVVFNYKAASRMLLNEVSDIADHVVYENKFLVLIPNQVFELFDFHNAVWALKHVLLSDKHLVENLEESPY